MTYLDLIQALQQLPPERLQDNVTLFNTNDGEFYPVIALEITGQGEEYTEAGGVLDDGHAYLVCP